MYILEHWDGFRICISLYVATRTESINPRVWLIFGPAEPYIAQTVSDQKFRKLLEELYENILLLLAMAKMLQKPQ